MDKDNGLFQIRLCNKEADLNFIYATWLRGLYYGNEWFNEINQHTFFQHYKHIVYRFLERSNSKINVACLKEDSDVILGYCVYEMPSLHWVHVKDAWRRIGIAKALIPPGITTVTHLTKMGKSIKPKEWEFNPFLDLNNTP